MKNSKLNRNRNPFTEQEIAQDENFDKLLKTAKANKLKKNLIVGGVITLSVLLLVGLLVFLKPNKVNKEATVEVPETTQGAIKPNLTGIPQSAFTVNAQQGGELVFNNTRIVIPQNAFMDSNGNEILGKVELTYREFHNPIDFFLAGIPMVYDSAGVEYHFESAGMFEIYGFQHGTPIHLAKPIEVKLASLHQGDYFNMYKLDTLTGVWTYLGKDTSVVGNSSASNPQEIANINERIANIEKELPVKKTKNGVCIKIDFNAAEFPELESLKEVLFEVDATDKNFSPDLAKKDWDDIKLKKVEEDYILTFYDKFKPTKIKATPVLSDAAYKKVFTEYELKLKELEKQKKDILETKKRTNVVRSDYIDFTTEDISVSAKEAERNYKAEYKVERLFMINDFGVYNSDCPMKLPKGKTVEPLFVYKNDTTNKIEKVNFATIYLVEENKNTLYHLYEFDRISYNPNNKYVIWGIYQGKLCVLPAKDFKQLTFKGKGSYKTEMKILNEEITSVEQVREFLNLQKLFKDV